MKKTNLLLSLGKALLVFLLLVVLLGMFLMDMNFFSSPKGWFALPYGVTLDFLSSMLSLLFGLCCFALNWHKPYGLELTAEGYININENSSPLHFRSVNGVGKSSSKKGIRCFSTKVINIKFIPRGGVVKFTIQILTV